MVTFTDTCAVPGVMWPGSIWPGEPLPESAPASEPVIFSLGPSRLRWTVLKARNSQGAGMTLNQAAVSTDDVQILVQALASGIRLTRPRIR